MSTHSPEAMAALCLAREVIQHLADNPNHNPRGELVRDISEGARRELESRTTEYELAASDVKAAQDAIGRACSTLLSAPKRG